MSLFDSVYKPDVLTCLSDLSNDEVMTPPDIANRMLDLLPKEIWHNPSIKILDPACKSGVFLREAAKRFIEGEKDVYPDLQERCDHIFKEQLYGIAITELTSLLSRRSLYCSKYPNGPFSIVHFDDVEGNVHYSIIKHTWDSTGKCIFCGATEDKFGEDQRKGLESHAYQFIHTIRPEEIFNMHFDVIVSNPPYQINVGVKKENYAIAIYQKFIEQAKKLNPRYITMIIPARWYSSGRGLDDFRKEMLNDEHVRILVDYPNPYDCFQGVDVAGGVCYFLWNRDDKGSCTFTSVIGDTKRTVERKLNEYPVFVRDITGLNLIKKIKKLNINNGKCLDRVVSGQTPFGIITSYHPKQNGTPCWFTQKIGKQFVSSSDVSDNFNCKKKWKLLIPEAPIAGQTDFTKPVGLYYEGNTIIAKPDEVCTQTWLVAGSFDTEEETKHFRSYLLTKTVRFLILQAVVSQHVSREKFCFVPDYGKYDSDFSDDRLRTEWGITDDEWNYINSRIHNYGYDKEEGDDNA